MFTQFHSILSLPQHILATFAQLLHCHAILCQFLSHFSLFFKDGYPLCLCCTPLLSNFTQFCSYSTPFSRIFKQLLYNCYTVTPICTYFKLFFTIFQGRVSVMMSMLPDLQNRSSNTLISLQDRLGERFDGEYWRT